MDGDAGGAIPDDLREWVDERADAEGVEPRTVLTRALTTYRLAVADSGESLADLDAVSDRLDSVEERVDGLEGELDEKIDDVRTRVVQVKRETDEKAPRDHDHPALRERLDGVEEDVETVRDRLSELDARLDAGFDNYEEILTYLDETTTDLDDHLHVVAQSLVDLRSRAADVEAAGRERAALADLLRTANDAGERKATCENCGETVHLDLLAEPRCPACRSAFDELSPSRGFFGSATLHTGRPPALEAAATDGDAADGDAADGDAAERTPVASLLDDERVTDTDTHHGDEPPRQTPATREHDDG